MRDKLENASIYQKEENNCEKNQTKKSLFSTYFFLYATYNTTPNI